MADSPLPGDDAARRLILNLSTSSILAAHLVQGQPITEKVINRAVETASNVDQAVRKRLRWEARKREDSGR